MPTGFTYDVAEGKITDPKDFALKLARGMGALSGLDSDEPIPERFETPDTYSKEVLKLRLEKERLLELTYKEAQQERLEEYAAYEESLANAKEKWEKTKQNYYFMLDKVEKWENAPEGLKEFAIEQLKQSIDFDCGSVFKYYGPVPEKDALSWLDKKIEALNKSIKYYYDLHTIDIDKTEARNKWIKQLKEFLK